MGWSLKSALIDLTLICLNVLTSLSTVGSRDKPRFCFWLVLDFVQLQTEEQNHWNVTGNVSNSWIGGSMWIYLPKTYCNQLCCSSINQSKYFFWKSQVTILWFDLLNCEYFLVSDSKLKIFELWTKWNILGHRLRLLKTQFCWHFIKQATNRFGMKTIKGHLLQPLWMCVRIEYESLFWCSLIQVSTVTY